MEQYEVLEMEVIRFETEDVIVTSGGCETNTCEFDYSGGCQPVTDPV